MFIPPKKYIDQLASQPAVSGNVRLQNSYLILDREVAALIFEETANVYVSYRADVQKLFVVPSHDEVFRKMHNPALLMLKDKTSQGDKSIALHEILLDNDLNAQDRSLDYEIRETRKMLVVLF
jgi:hypothetical protein